MRIIIIITLIIPEVRMIRTLKMNTIDPSMRALSIQQPFAEMILRGVKTIEYRRRRTNIRERVYIYASLTPGDMEDFREINVKPEELPTGVLVGSVEIVDCKVSRERRVLYEWILANPERLPEPLKPETHPQPMWFYPLREKGRRS